MNFDDVFCLYDEFGKKEVTKYINCFTTISIREYMLMFKEINNVKCYQKFLEFKLGIRTKLKYVQTCADG